MKQLLVLRHAAAESDSASGRDFDRRLSERGRADARAIGRAMRDRGLAPERVIASPARRVVETIGAVAECLPTPDADYDARIYDDSLDALLEIVRETDDHVSHLLIVGHNPCVHALTLTLTVEDEAGRRRSVGLDYPTATLAAIDLRIDRWADVAPGMGTIRELIRPRDLAG